MLGGKNCVRTKWKDPRRPLNLNVEIIMTSKNVQKQVLKLVAEKTLLLTARRTSE